MNQQELEFKVSQIVYQKIFDDDECNKILALYTDMRDAISYTSEQHKIGNSIIETGNKLETNGIRRSKSKTLYYEECKWVLEKIGNLIEQLNQLYFKLGPMEINHIDILEYSISDEFKWHTDLGPTPPFNTRKISIVAFISDRNEYEGGQLEFMPKLKEPLKMEKGYLIAFPSHKVHRVTPITSGTRRVLVTWLNG